MPISNIKNDTDEMQMHETLRGSCLRAKPLGEIAENISRPFHFSGKKEVIFINTGDVLEGKFLHANYSSVSSLPGQAKKAINKGDILYSEIRPGNKRYVLVDFDADDYVVSTKFMVVRPISEVTPEFLYIVLTSDECEQTFKLIADSRSGTFPQITFDSVAYHPVRFPDENAQAEIVKISNSITKKIELNRQTNQTLEQIAQALFKSWFVDFEPTRAKIAAKEAGASPEEIERAAMCAISGKTPDQLAHLPPETQQNLKTTAALFPDALVDSELGEVPEGWEVKSLSDIAQYANGKIEVSKLNVSNYISTENMLENRGGVTAATSLPSVPTVPCFSPNHILISNIRPYFKKIWLARFDGGRSNDVLGFVAKDKGCEEFLYNLLYQDEFFEFMMRTSKGAKMPRGDKDAIADWKFVCASKASRLYFSEIIRPSYSIIEGLNSENIDLSNIRENLLPKLLSGEIQLQNDEGT